MVYETVEAYLDKKKISFPRWFRVPTGNVRVLVTIIDDSKSDDTYELRELPVSQTTKELKDLSRSVLRKDLSHFTDL